MTYHWPPGDVYPRQHRASTAPAQSQPSFPRGPAIPPSLIPGYRHRQTISATGGVDRLLFSSGPDTSNHPMSIVSTTLVPVSDVALFSMTPSPYRDLQRPPPPVPVPVPPHQQPMVPPLPPKTPLKSPSSSPMLPPKPPSFIPAPLLPKPPRSKSQPPPPLPRGASPPFNAPPPPPMLPPKPLGARSSSVIVTPSHLPLLNTTPSVKSNANGSPNIDDATSLILPSLTSPAESSEGSPQMNEEEELELALKLSAHAEKEYAESLLSQDEALARALEESLLDSVASPFPPKLQPGLETADGKRVLSSSMAKPWDVHPYSPKQHYHLPLPARMDSSTSLALSDEAQFREDEALARKLEAEYESGRSTPTTQSNHVMDPNPPEYPHLPRYADIVDKDTGTYNCSVAF
ncbi:hypothetical protein B0F90DRAFT_543205 [Multifurca ochricompacta]|uniref:Uncharacterized protein n=1 Tax=Multifurca ochricompacta TaxID=376703 RepID=A0AAD4MBC3_9AGAM|nr:hypothetical protein B0F90DRAFT_543205 [Multifurca ochricompacta]